MNDASRHCAGETSKVRPKTKLRDVRKGDLSVRDTFD
jgi:hypothetical protein